MIHIILLLLLALTGAAEEAPVPLEGVITETCDLADGEGFDGECQPTTTTSTPTPSELPGPRPNQG